jgi:hypothetical protein
MKKIILLLISVFLLNAVFSQVSLYRMVGGKYAKEYKTGFGGFGSINIPLNEANNRVLTLDAFDFGFFFLKPTSDLEAEGGAFISFKAGYRYIFSEESITGFFVEPQAGFALIGVGPDYGQDLTKGLSLALNVGYSLEVGQRGNNFTFGLKYEADLANNDMSIHTVGLRVAYHFTLFGRKNDY